MWLFSHIIVMATQFNWRGETAVLRFEFVRFIFTMHFVKWQKTGNGRSSVHRLTLLSEHFSITAFTALLFTFPSNSTCRFVPTMHSTFLHKLSFFSHRLWSTSVHLEAKPKLEFTCLLALELKWAFTPPQRNQTVWDNKPGLAWMCPLKFYRTFPKQ